MATNLSSKAIGKRLQHQLLPAIDNASKTHLYAQQRHLSEKDINVASSVLSGAIVKFDYSSKRALKDSQRVARPPRVEYFDNGMVLIERDNETPEFISGELFVAQYGKAGV